MKRIMTKVEDNILKFSFGLKERVRTALKNERGDGGIIVTIIFAALIILAALATDPLIRDLFTGVITRFSTWLNTRMDTLFS